ncbi:ATP-binding cassette domain-containing protein (plasmid) [Rhodobacteraceae bacterium SC52]|nr:ATP-binding cassette domain-containing protein [Rhodobacteraceae bacterium SC52]
MPLDQLSSTPDISEGPSLASGRGRPPSTLLGAIGEMKGTLTAVFLFSFFINLLMLTGPLFMLQVYDRVLGSQSPETLVTLFVLVCFLFGCLYMLDTVRGMIMVRCAARFRRRMEDRVHIVGREHVSHGQDWGPTTAMGELDGIQRLMASPVTLALFDLPWMPFYFGLLFVFHPMMGWLGLVAAAVITGLAMIKRLITRRPTWYASRAKGRWSKALQAAEESGSAQRMLGLEDGFDNRWLKFRATSLRNQVQADERAWMLLCAARTFRIFLQSAMLAVGAHLVLIGDLTSGAMIAGSILLGKALGPLEAVVNNVTNLQTTFAGARRLERNLSRSSADLRSRRSAALPDVPGTLDVTNVTFKPRELSLPVFTRLSFDVQPGEALAIVGRSGVGKSALVRLLTGGNAATMGRVTLSGFPLYELSESALAKHIGLLPQFLTFFDGTVAENIARYDPDMVLADVVAAAELVHVMDKIELLPKGLQTDMHWAKQILSAGTLQRIALARAVYSKPNILIMDEPNAGLDQEAGALVSRLIKAQTAAGKSAIVITHSPNLLHACDKILILENGTQKAFGPRDEILAKLAAASATNTKTVPHSDPTAPHPKGQERSETVET